MPAALTVLEAVLAAIVLGLLLALLLTYARRQAITRGRAVFLCGLREKGDTKFQQGLASLDGGALAWFRLNGVSVRSTRRWDRPRLEFSGASPISAPELASIPLQAAAGAMSVRERDLRPRPRRRVLHRLALLGGVNAPGLRQRRLTSVRLAARRAGSARLVPPPGCQSTSPPEPRLAIRAGTKSRSESRLR